MTNALVKWTRRVIGSDPDRGFLTLDAYRTATPKFSGDIDREVPYQITLVVTCPDCLATLEDGTTPSDADRLMVGFTDVGLQVWCKVHDRNVLHVEK